MNSANNQRFKSKKKQCRESPKSFSEKEVTLQSTPLFFPAGLEKPFLLLYFISLPYLVGLFFLFAYVAEGKLGLFASVFQNSAFLLTWTIGYEIIAVFILLYLFKLSLSFVNDTRNGVVKPFRRPH